MSYRILIVGGYGQVGKIVSRALARRHPGAVAAAGRSYARAAALSEETDGAVIPYRLDLDSMDDVDAALDGVELVVSCVERSDAMLAERSLKRGIGYVEVGASLDTVRRTLALNELAIRSNAAAICNAGLAPGLSNLLAADLARRFDSGAYQIDIFLMLGLGDTHGLDAVRWMLTRASGSFVVQTPNGPVRVQPLSDPAVFRLPSERRSRVAYRFDLADQHVIPETTGAAGASTRICFDSRLVTRLLGTARRLGLNKWLSRIPPAAVANVLKRLPVGDDHFALMVMARGREGGVLCAGASGRKEARATGLTIAHAAEVVLSGRIPPGVHHIERVLTLQDVREGLDGGGIRIWLPVSGSEHG